MWNVYVLESQKDSKLYIGVSQDVVIRVRRHNAGGVSSTKYRRPLRLIGSKACSSFTEARAAEVNLKRLKNPSRVRAWILA